MNYVDQKSISPLRTHFKGKFNIVKDNKTSTAYDISSLQSYPHH